MQKGQNRAGYAEAHVPELLLPSHSQGAAELRPDAEHFMHVSAPA